MALTNDKVFQMRASADWLKSIDDWRRAQPELPSRAEAIRRLVEAGLQLQDPELQRLIEQARFNAQVRG